MPPSAAEIINDPRFTQSFELPADPANGRTRSFRLQYADFGYRNVDHPEEETVLLFFAGLLSTRLLHAGKDELAKRHSIRVIAPDRPGIGGSDRLAKADAIRVWRGELAFEKMGKRMTSELTPRLTEAIVALLRDLGIHHVAVACHSGGTVWGLDFLLHHPHLLHPELGRLAIGGPWILPSHSGSALFSIVRVLPSSLIGQTDKLARLINNYVGPAVGASIASGVSLAARVSPSTSPSFSAPGHCQDPTCLEGRHEQSVISKVVDRAYAEGIRGVGADAVLLMQKGGGWSDWGDFDRLVPRLIESLRASQRRLRVDVLYAEKDLMIGDGSQSKGAKWFDQLWRRDEHSDVVDYRTRTVMKADHDGVWNMQFGAAQSVFGDISKTAANESRATV
jgi:pimeloyl-ACP methyl ester carboxylesterase